MKTYWFTLRLDGPAADTDDFSEALYDDGHDCVLTTSNRVVKAAFSRDADTLRDAVLSAISSVHRADSSVRVVGLEIDEEGQAIDDAIIAA